jgi:gluconate 2-dehydrogenase gamma chain
MRDAANSGESPGSGRRRFIRAATALTGLAILPGSAGAAPESPAPTGSLPTEVPPSIYLALDPDEAAFVEQLVEVMCPADDLTPGGVECGLALFIDRQLAGPFGRGERLYQQGPWRPGRREDGYQLPLTPAQYFKLGLAAAGAACTKLHGRSFNSLAATDADAFLQGLAAGKIGSPEVPLDVWFNEMVYPLVTQACFADPVYGGNRGKVFWKMIGYPGLPAVNGLNMIKYRGKPFPGGAAPLSMEDFS